jgi:O-antigen/teichoic acid export membrane protein
VLFLVLSRVAGLGASSFFCLRLYPALGRRCAFDRSLIRCLLGFGGWVTVSDATSPILASFDRFLIGALQSIAAVGFYTPSYLISTRLGILPQSLAATLYPAFSTSAGRGDSEWIKSALVRSLKYLLLLVGPAALVLAFFARPLLTLWLGAKFADEGALALQILAVGALINSLAFVPYHLLRGLGRPDLTAKFHLLEVPLYVALAWFLVTAFGLPGAALAWSLRVSLDFLLLILAACWISRTSPRLLVGRQIRRSVATLTALAVSLSVLWAISHALLANALLALLLTTGFLVGTWHYVLDLEEKWHIRLWLKAAL